MMRPHRIIAVRSIAVVATLAMLLTVAVPATLAQDREKAAEATEKGLEYLQKEEYENALREFEKALEADDTVWQAWFYQGMALGSLGDAQGAQSAFLRATELNPGNHDINFRAAFASFQIGDFDTAWEQIIRAHQAGRPDMEQYIARLREVSDEPEGLDERLAAPRLFVHEPDIEGVSSSVENPWAREVGSRVDTIDNIDQQEVGEAPGRVDSTSAASRATGSGMRAVTEAMPDIATMMRITRQAIAESSALGLVPQQEASQYVLVIDIDDLAEEGPRRLEGYVKLMDPESGEEVYRRVLELSNINNLGELNAEVRQYVRYLEDWFREGGER